MAGFAKWPFRGVDLSNASHKRTSWSHTEGELALSIRDRGPLRPAQIFVLALVLVRVGAPTTNTAIRVSRRHEGDDGAAQGHRRNNLKSSLLCGDQGKAR